jgi:hypothetical protein
MTGRRWWQARGFVVSAAFLTVIVLLGAASFLLGGHDTSSVTPKRPALSPVVARPESGCLVLFSDRDQRIPLRPLPAHWDTVGEYQVPGQSQIGPGRFDGHARHCWAHTPTGATFAAYNDVALMDTYNTDVSMLRVITARGAARDEMLRQGGTTASDPNRSADVFGFRVVDYSPSAATIRLGVRVATKPQAAALSAEPITSQLVTLDVRMRWEDGDWRYVVDPTLKAQHLDSVSGMVTWGRS